MKGLKGANCSRELLQKDQAFSPVFSLNIHSYQPFLEKQNISSKIHTSQPNLCSSFFTFAQVDQDPLAKPSDNLPVPSFKLKALNTKSKAHSIMESPVPCWALGSMTAASFRCIFSVTTMTQHLHFLGTLVWMCCWHSSPRPPFNDQEEILTWGSLLLSAGADVVHHDLKLLLPPAQGF